MSLSTPLRPSLGKLTLFLFLLTILQLSFSSLASGQPTVAAQSGSPAKANPCQKIYFQVYNAAPTTITRIQWYGNGAYLGNTLNVTDPFGIVMNTNDGGVGSWEYNVYAVIYYSDGTTSQTTTLQEPLNSIYLQAPTYNTPPYLNCLSPVTFSSIFVGDFNPLPAGGPDYVASYAWTFPSASWAYGSSSNTVPPSVTVTPDASSAGNVMVTATLTCGFLVPSNVLTVTRPTEPPTFGASPGTICNNSTNTFTINPSCGATSYVWTISGNASATFQANGTQSLTTTTTSAAISTGTIGNSGFTLSVEAVYPGGATSTPATENVVSGTAAPTIEMVSGEMITGPGPFSFTMLALEPSEPILSYNWIIDPIKTISGQNTKNVTITVPALSSGQTGDVYLTAEYETTCSGWVSSSQYYFVDQGSGRSGLPPPTEAITLQPIAGMSQLAINSNANAANSDNTSYALKSAAYPIKAANVYNTAGQLMKKASFGGANTLEYLDIHDLPNGIYFVQVMTSNGSTTKKFVVLH